MDGLEELTLELCGKCPQNCLHCSSNSSPACGDQVDLVHSLRLIREAAALGTYKLSLGGGEPLLSPHLEEVLDEANKLGMQLEVFTCGIARLPAQLSPIPTHLLAHWQKLQRLKVIFSLQGASERTHDQITQTKGSYEVLLTSLKACLHAGIVSEINFVPLKPNVGEFAPLMDIAANLGVGRVSVLRFVPQGRGAVNQSCLELSRDEEEIFIKQLIRLREHSPVVIRTGSPFNGIVPGNRVPCRAGFRKLVVQADGNVLPCEVFKHDRRRKWNLNVCKQSLEQILRSEALARLRHRLEASNCLRCPIHNALRAEQMIDRELDHVSEAAIYTC
jgi:radical SAM protein with 4Fe4S-binding SPASM domain